MRKIFARAYFGFFMMMMFTATAFAYLDPGTVSYVVSMIAGLFIAGGAAIAIFRRKIKLFFQNMGKKKQEDTAAPADTTPEEFNPMDEVIDPMADEEK